MDRAGVKYREVELDAPGNEMLVESMKEDLGTNVLSVPMVLTPDSSLLRNLVYISEYFRGMNVAKA